MYGISILGELPQRVFIIYHLKLPYSVVENVLEIKRPVASVMRNPHQIFFNTNRTAEL